MPSRVIPIVWANSFWVTSGFAWIATKILSWVVSPDLLGSPSGLLGSCSNLLGISPDLLVDLLVDSSFLSVDLLGVFSILLGSSPDLLGSLLGSSSDLMGVLSVDSPNLSVDSPDLLVDSSSPKPS